MNYLNIIKKHGRHNYHSKDTGFLFDRSGFLNPNPTNKSAEYF